MKRCLLISLVIINFIPSVWGAEKQKDKPSTQPNEVQKVSMDVVKQAVLDKNPNVVIVDVRDEDHYKKGHIAGAIHICHKMYNNFEGNETEFPGLTKDGVNYVYCYTKESTLSEKAARKFASLGYPSKDMIGGFDSWEEAGYPVESSLVKEEAKKQN